MTVVHFVAARFEDGVELSVFDLIPDAFRRILLAGLFERPTMKLGDDDRVRREVEALEREAELDRGRIGDSLRGEEDKDIAPNFFDARAAAGGFLFNDKDEVPSPLVD